MKVTKPRDVSAKAIGKSLVSGSLGMGGDLAQMAMMAQPGAMMSPTVREAADKMPLTSEKIAQGMGVDTESPEFLAGSMMSPGPPGSSAVKLAKAGTVAKNLVGAIPVAGALKKAKTPAVPIGDSKIVSTRFPTAKRAEEDATQDLLIVDLETLMRDPDQFKHNIKITESYPNIKLKGTPAQRGEMFIEHVKDNLIFLHDQVPEATRARSQLWYDGANKIANDFGKKFERPPEQIAGVFAVLSPQKDWFMNVSLGERVLEVMTTKQDAPWTPEMQATAARIYDKPKYKPLLESIDGKTLGELDNSLEKSAWVRIYDETYHPREHRIVTPEGEFVDIRMTDKGQPMKTGWGSNNEIAKAINIIEDGSMANITKQLGGQHKVRNFYNNIMDPNDASGHVTIDTHAVAAGLMRPLAGADLEVAHNFGSNVKGTVGPKNSSFTGMKGTYGIYAEAYRRAAKERGILPRQMQSITWEAVRGLYPAGYKSVEKNVEAINNIWTQHKKGKISLDEARQQALDHAGGINAPEWE
jgi:hypothetical protein